MTPSTIHLDESCHLCLTRFSFLLEDDATLQDDITTSGTFPLPSFLLFISNSLIPHRLSSFTAPEVLTGGKYGKAADWWAVGTILHEFCTSKVGFPHYPHSLSIELAVLEY